MLHSVFMDFVGCPIWVDTNLLRKREQKKFNFFFSKIELNYFDPVLLLGHMFLALCGRKALGLHCPCLHLFRCLPSGPCLAVDIDPRQPPLSCPVCSPGTDPARAQLPSLQGPPQERRCLRGFIPPSLAVPTLLQALGDH